jgi:hypothetical protein
MHKKRREKKKKKKKKNSTLRSSFSRGCCYTLCSISLVRKGSKWEIQQGSRERI